MIEIFVKARGGKPHNKDRRRYYGKRIGDIVIAKFSGSDDKCRVIDYGALDNNSLVLQNLRTNKVFSWVAEWCEIVTKVEDIQDNGKDQN